MFRVSVRQLGSNLAESFPMRISTKPSNGVGLDYAGVGKGPVKPYSGKGISYTHHTC